tara:strand:+ start:463 stop:651 length:189 start_codon:yes stop_codon:yes gene_type:complete
VWEWLQTQPQMEPYLNDDGSLTKKAVRSGASLLFGSPRSSGHLQMKKMRKTVMKVTMMVMSY